VAQPREFTAAEARILQQAIDKEDHSPDAVQEEMEAMAINPEEKEAAGVLKKAKMIVAYFNRSTQAMDELRKIYISNFTDVRGQEKAGAPVLEFKAD